MNNDNQTANESSYERPFRSYIAVHVDFKGFGMYILLKGDKVQLKT